MTDSLPLPLTIVHSLCQHGQFSKGLLQGGVVGVCGGGVLKQVLDEEHVARNSLDGLDK